MELELKGKVAIVTGGSKGIGRVGGGHIFSYEEPPMAQPLPLRGELDCLWVPRD
jgi:hypothetical protein